MTALTWDAAGTRLFETGVSNGVLYTGKTGGGYNTGVAWNGLTAITESPSGAEATPIYADNIKYLSLTSAEEFGATIEAYTYPDDFMICDGSAALQTTNASGIFVGQQTRMPFCLVYKTKLGNDVSDVDYGYKLHIIYGAKAAPSERAYSTINDSPEAITFSWEITTVPVVVAATGILPTASLTIDSTRVSSEHMTLLNNKLFGSVGTAPTIQTPDEIIALLT